MYDWFIAYYTSTLYTQKWGAEGLCRSMVDSTVWLILTWMCTFDRPAPCTPGQTPAWSNPPPPSVGSTCHVTSVCWPGTPTVPGTPALRPASIYSTAQKRRSESILCYEQFALRWRPLETFLSICSQIWCISEMNKLYVTPEHILKLILTMKYPLFWVLSNNHEYFFSVWFDL